MPYRPRVVDAELSTLMSATGAVVVEGPKACGKTETARQLARSEVLLDTDRSARVAVGIDPNLILAGARPRLIDEWQLEPIIWNYIRRAVDARPSEPGQFILTGSSVPADDITRHSGAGRITRLRMRPMTLFETGHSTGAVSLKSLLSGGAVASPDPGLTVTDLAERIAVGGWPALIGRSVPGALQALRGYLDEMRRVDINRVDGVRRDPEGVDRLLRSLARNVATSASIATLAADSGGSEPAISRDTVTSYLSALSRLMILEDLPAWSPRLRSRSRLRVAPTRHFVDPSLAVAALQATPARLLADLEWLGFLFESLVVRDLRVYGQALGGNLFHYRDDTDLEVDAVLELGDGRWAGFEVKLGQARIEEGAANLKRLAERVDERAAGRPAALVVVTGSGYGYLRDDGIAVLPIGTLSP